MNRRPPALLIAALVGLLGASVAAGTVRAADPPFFVGTSFASGSTHVGSTTVLHLGVSTPESSSAPIVTSFTDTLPAGLTVATGSSTVCGIGNLTTTAPSTIHFTATFPDDQGWSCDIAVTVTGAVAGDYTYSPADFTSNLGAVTPTSASLTVVAPPTLTKAFGASAVAQGASTSLTFTVHNPNATASLSGVTFTDALPGGLAIADPNGLGGTCAGSVTAPAAGDTVQASGIALAAGASCTVVVNVVGAAEGTWHNVTAPIGSTEGGTGGTATDDLAVGIAPIITAAFDSPTVAIGGTTTLRIGLIEPETASGVTGLAFTASLPAGIATPDLAATSACGGTLSVAFDTIHFSGGTLDPGESCQLTFSVTGVVASYNFLATSELTSSSPIAGGQATARITVLAPPTIAKAFGATAIALGDSTSLTFTIGNGNFDTLTGVAFGDDLPPGLVVATPASAAGTCGASVTAAPASSSILASDITLAPDSSCTVTVDVTGAAQGTWHNVTGAITSTEGGTGGTASADITVAIAPVLGAAFTPASIPLHGSSTLTIGIANPETSIADATGVGFTATLPAGLSTPDTTTTACGTGTVIVSGGTITLANGTVPIGWSCPIYLTVTGETAGVHTLVTGALASDSPLPGNTATATLTVVAPPTIAKAFAAPAVALGESTNLTFTIGNPNATAPLSGIGFSDPLPAGLRVAATPAVSSDCGGTVTANPAGGRISLSDGSLAASASCTITVQVTGAAQGTWHNVTGSITSTEGSTGSTAEADLTVAVAPTIGAAFTPASIPLHGTSTLTITLYNPETSVTDLTGLAFSSALPPGLSTADLTTDVCNGGTLTVAGGSITLAGGSLPVGWSCTMTLAVRGDTAGVHTFATSSLSSSGPLRASGALATLTVVGPPSLAKAFDAPSIPSGGTTLLTFNIDNANPTSLSGVGFTDVLPAGLVVASIPGPGSTCGTLTAVPGSDTISLTNASLIATGSCVLGVYVTATSPGLKHNVTSAIESIEGGDGDPATADLTVMSAPTIAKAFGAASIPVGGTTTLTFTIGNPNAAAAIHDASFADDLPDGLVIPAPYDLGGTCSGSIDAGGGTVFAANLVIDAGSSCTIVVNVTGTTAGLKHNVTDAITSAEVGIGGTASADLIVVAPPTIAKEFAAESVPLGGSTTLTFTLGNPDASVALTGVSFADTFPAGLTVAPSPAVANDCGGTVTAAAGSDTLSLSGGTLAAAGTCTVSVRVTGTVAGVVHNVTGNVSSIEGGTGGTATADLTVVAPPTIAKEFAAGILPLGGTTTLEFRVANPNASVELTGVELLDTLPAGLVVAATPNAVAGCGGDVTAVAGSSTVGLAHGTLPPGWSCTFSVDVTGTTIGAKHNVTAAVTSIEGGTGGTATADLTVAGPPVLAKAFGASTVAVGGSTSLTFTITNPNADIPLGSIAFTDTLPSGLIVATPNGLAAACTGGFAADAGTGNIEAASISLGAGASCTVSINVIGTTPGVKHNVTSAIASDEGGTGATATADLVVVAAPTMTVGFHPATILVDHSSTLTFVITNPTVNTVALTGVAFTTTLPSGLSAATASVGRCGGTLTTTPSQIALAGATIAAGGTCEVSVTVAGRTTGHKTVTAAASAVESGTGGAASAVLNVVNVLPPDSATGVTTGQDPSGQPMAATLLALLMAGVAGALVRRKLSASRPR